MKPWYITVALIAQWMPALPMLLGLTRLPQLERAGRLTILMLFMALLLQFLGNQLEFSAGSNSALYHLHVLVEFSLMLLIYREVLGTMLPGWVFPAMAMGFAALSILDATVIHGLGLAPDTARTAEALLIDGLVIFYFVQLFRQTDGPPATHRFHFWLSVGNLLFFNVNLLVYIYANYLFEHYPSAAATLYLVHSFSVILLYLCYSAGFLLSRPLSS